MHTTASDGSLSPAKVVGLAADGGLDVLAITDHDTVAGIPAAVEAVGETSLHLIPGIEVSSTYEGAEYHILGYFVDVEADSIQAHEGHAVGGRESRMEEMVDRLRRQGLLIEMTDVLDAAGPARSAIARPPSSPCACVEGIREIGGRRVRPADRRRPPGLRAHRTRNARRGDPVDSRSRGDSGLGASTHTYADPSFAGVHRSWAQGHGGVSASCDRGSHKEAGARLPRRRDSS